MDKYLITGFSGFVSAHFLDYLESLEEPVAVLGLDLNDAPLMKPFNFVKWEFQKLDLLNAEAVFNVLKTFRPDYILHLASISSVAHSWKFPAESFVNNTNIFLNLADQVRKSELRCRLLSVGSSEEYGTVSTDQLPLHEEMQVKPQSPYAVARVSQEMLSVIYAKSFGIDIVITRSFNHIGPGQKDIFVVSSFAKQLVEIKRKRSEPFMSVGNIDLIRDFVDVRDVVRAYYLLLKKGEAGEIYNICSGRGTSLKELIGMMQHILKTDVEIRPDSARMRPGENPVIVGSNQKIKQAVGWQPEISLERSLRDIIDSRSIFAASN